MSDPQYTRQVESELSPTLVGHDDSGHPEFSFLGVTYRRHADGLYYSGKLTGIGRKALHNVVYRRKHGKILLGHAVVHADGDPANNAINNLVLGAKQRQPRIVLSGVIYRLYRGYYRAFPKPEPPYEELYHREVWRVAYGEIPEGLVLHHIDNCSTNNSLENLQLMTKSQHSSHHRNKEQRENPDKFRALNQAGTAALLGTKKQRIIPSVCACCGKEYLAAMPVEGNSFCSPACVGKYRYHSGVDLVVKKCAACGKEFHVNKYRKDAIVCSFACAGARRRATTAERREKNKAEIAEKKAALALRTKEVMCKVCGSTFTSPFSSYRETCSDACLAEGRSQVTALRHARDAEARAANLVEKTSTCVVCGQLFAPHLRTQATCSSECRKVKVSMDQSERVRLRRAKRNDT